MSQGQPGAARGELGELARLLMSLAPRWPTGTGTGTGTPYHAHTIYLAAPRGPAPLLALDIVAAPRK